MSGKHRSLTVAAQFWVAAALAQQPLPHIGYVYPAGGRQGTTFEVTVGGQFLNGAARAWVSGEGIETRIVEHVRPTPPAEINRLREQLRELAAKTPVDRKALAELRAKLAAAVRRPANPALGETVTVQVAIAADAAPGDRELRLSTPAGLTNPLVFSVGRLPEVAKKPDRVMLDPRAGGAVHARPSAPPADVELPVVVNGQIMPGSVDRYRFTAKNGLRLVAATEARKLIPYISDAVPGWFQAAVTLYDGSGKELAYADDYRFNPDPVLYYEIPAEGQYVLEIKDALYRGREDFVYRIAIGELPFVTSVFPLGDGEKKGWNLPPARRAKGRKPPLEREPNNEAKSAQRVKLPAIVNGRIDRPGDLDVFSFKGRRGDRIVAEVFARRLDSPLDSMLRLADSRGGELAANDDFEDPSAGLTTHQADSRIEATLPANGVYVLRLGDTQGKGGAEYAYRLRIGAPQPDFELRVVPASVSVRAGNAAPITVHALRRDGFAGDIALELKDAPAGFSLSGAVIPAGQDRIRLTLAAPPAALREPVSLKLEGRAGGLRRVAVPAEDMEQAFAYHHLVPAKEWMVQVTAGRNRALWKVADDAPVRLRAGGTAPVRFAARLGRFAEQVQYALNQPPEGITIDKVSNEPGGVSILLRAEKVKPGLKGNLIVDASVLGPNARRVAFATLPAIRFEVIP